MCVCVCVCARACILGREGSWVFAGAALVVAWTAMYLTGYSPDDLVSVNPFHHLIDVTPV